MPACRLILRRSVPRIRRSAGGLYASRARRRNLTWVGLPGGLVGNRHEVVMLSPCGCRPRLCAKREGVRHLWFAHERGHRPLPPENLLGPCPRTAGIASSPQPLSNESADSFPRIPMTWRVAASPALTWNPIALVCLAKIRQRALDVMVRSMRGEEGVRGRACAVWIAIVQHSRDSGDVLGRFGHSRPHANASAAQAARRFVAVWRPPTSGSSTILPISVPARLSALARPPGTDAFATRW